MAIVLDAPQEVTETGAAEFLPATESADAAEATELLETVDEGDADPQITICLTRRVEDPIVKFSAEKGETLTACIDSDGDTYIPFGDHRIYMEAEEFDIVEPLSEATSADSEIQPGESSVSIAPEDKLTELVVSDSLAQAAPDDGSAAIDREATQSQLPESIGGSGGAGQAAVGCVSDTTSNGDTVQYGSGQRPNLREPTPFDRYQSEKQALEEQLSDLVRECAHLKERAKSAKKAAEVVAEEIDELVASWENGDYEENLAAEKQTAKPEATPGAAGGASVSAPAGSLGKQEQAGSSQECPASQPAVSTSTAEVDMTARLRAEHAEQERYRQVLEAATIAELGLPPKIEEKLQEANATNIWRLEQLRGDISLGREKWPKGIGPGKVTTIENAIDSWVARNRATWQVSTPEPGPEIQKPAEQPADQPTDAPIGASAESQPTAAEASAEPLPGTPPAEPSTVALATTPVASIPPAGEAVTIDDL